MPPRPEGAPGGLTLRCTTVHGFCGVWGLLAVGLLSKKVYVAEIYSWEIDDPALSWGVFYGSNGRLLACQLVGILAIAAWAALLTGGMFAALRRAGLLRISEAEEVRGLDVSHHGGTAYAVSSMDLEKALPAAARRVRTRRPPPAPPGTNGAGDRCA